MKQLVEYIAKALVDNPDAVEVTEFGDDQASMITLKVAREDLGKVIGKKGRTAKAMRTLLGATATKLRKRANLEIMEPEGDTPPDPPDPPDAESAEEASEESTETTAPESVAPEAAAVEAELVDDQA